MAIRMGQNLPQYNHVPSVHYLYCCGCGAHVAIIYYIPALWIISQVYICSFRVAVAENEPQHGAIHGMNLTVAVTYCVQCGNLLMWKIIAVSQPSNVYRVGGAVMRLDAFISWYDATLFDFLYGGNYEQAPPTDQDGGADGDAYEQDLGSNEQNVDSDGNGGIDEQVPNQDVDIVVGMGNIDLNASI